MRCAPVSKSMSVSPKPPFATSLACWDGFTCHLAGLCHQVLLGGCKPACLSSQQNPRQASAPGSSRVHGACESSRRLPTPAGPGSRDCPWCNTSRSSSEVWVQVWVQEALPPAQRSSMHPAGPPPQSSKRPSLCCFFFFFLHFSFLSLSCFPYPSLFPRFPQPRRAGCVL